MKTFKQFLLSEEELKNIKDIIEKDCGPFLREAKGAGFLHRGIRNFKSLQFKFAKAADYDEEGNSHKKIPYALGTVRKDRRPLNTSKEIHDMIDGWFNQAVRFKARSQALFTFGELGDSGPMKDYGTPCVIFPIGNFKYVWSTEVHDLFIQMPYENWDDDGLTGDELEETVARWLGNKDYRAGQLDKAIKSGNEVMVSCDTYYAIPYEYREQLQAALGITP